MPTLETPPNPASVTPPPPEQERTSGRIKAGRFGELDHSELVHLLDSLDDERAKARFRESVYISLFFWMIVIALLIFAPRYFPRRPEFVLPSGLTFEKRPTDVTLPPDVRRALEHAPRFKSAPKGPGKTAEAPVQQVAPQPPAPPQPAPAPQQNTQAAPPPVVQQSPIQQPKPPQVSALPSAPTPSVTPAKPSFANPNTSARDMVEQSARPAHSGGGGIGIQGGANGPVAARGMGTGVDILSDTQGVDFQPYLQKILREIYETWLPLIPEEARPPLNKQGEALIRFTIMPDGTIGANMSLDGSTHDDAINKSCWGSITGVGQFPPLPKQFHGPSLELRIHYLVNKEMK